MPGAILLPGAVLPAALAYGDLIEALGDDVVARTKDLELYAGGEPPPGYGLELEVDGVLREAEEAGFERFHLGGYSGGGAVALALAARDPDRLLSLALLEPAWFGNDEMSPAERDLHRQLDEATGAPAQELMTRFVRAQLAPGVEPPPPPPGPPPPWMAKRPAGIIALTEAFRRHELDVDALGSFERPVYFALGALSNGEYYGRIAERARAVFTDLTLDVWDGRHHFDPPHRAEPERMAARLRELWSRAPGGA